MLYLLCIAFFAVFHSATALKCHVQYGLDSRVLALSMLENPFEIPQKMLSSGDMEMECTGSTDVCIHAFEENLAYMKGCTSSCEEMKKELYFLEVVCCNTDMCNKGSLLDSEVSGFGDRFTNTVQEFYMRRYKF